ncbi:MAG: hypothetical protein M1520_00855 [Candidatus Marsarchaeota archaeon]|nr:hypothetical protein [Candidatus Marsarchaeota archaeon]
MLWLLGLMHLVLSLGDVDALIPIIIILILIAAAGGLTRGFDIFSLFGLGTLAGIGLGSRGSMAKRTAYDKSSSQYKEGFVSGSNEGNTHLPVGREGKLTKSDKFKAMGSIRGAKYGNTPKSSSLIAGAYHSYHALSGKAKAGTSNPSRDLIPGPNVLTKGAAIDSSPLVISKAAVIGAGAMTVKQMNDHIANRVRMAVLNPEKYGPKKRTVEQPSYSGKPNTLPFSSTDNAVGWLLSGRSGAALKTSRMRQLAANDPKAFRKEYNKIVRRELYRHMVNNKMIEKGSSFRMPSDKERMKMRYSKTISKEWYSGFKGQIEKTRNTPSKISVNMPGIKLSKDSEGFKGSILGKKFPAKKKEKK